MMGNGSWAARRVIVTGAQGYVGAALTRQLRALGAEVHAVSRTRYGAEDGMQWHCVDMTDSIALSDVIGRVGPSVVFHLGAMVTGSRNSDDLLPIMHGNLTASVNLLVAVQKHSRMKTVIAGSIEEPKPDDLQDAASSPYAMTKWAVTKYVELFGRLWDTPATVLRLGMVYGPGEQPSSRLVPYVITSLLKSQAPHLSNGSRLIDWIYIDDVVDALLACGDQPPPPGSALDIASGTQTSIRETVDLIRRLMGSPIEPAYGAVADRPFDQDQIADFAAASAALGWHPTIPLDTGMRRTIAWYRRTLGVDLQPTI